MDTVERGDLTITAGIPHDTARVSSHIGRVQMVPSFLYFVVEFVAEDMVDGCSPSPKVVVIGD